MVPQPPGSPEPAADDARRDRYHLRPMPIDVTHISPDAPGAGDPLTVAVVASRYNAWITEPLERGALEALERETNGAGRAVVLAASGSLELPTICGEAAMSGAFDAVVALGCIIRGETEHDRHIARAIIHNLTDVSAASGVPMGIGVLTVNDADQAEARAGGALGNKGAEAMEAALASVRTLRALREWVETNDARSGAERAGGGHGG